MTKSTFNTGERRGMIVIIGILMMIILVMFISRSINTTYNTEQTATIDSIARELHLQIEASEKSPIKKESTTKETKATKHQKKNKYIEREPLNELLPTD